MPPLATPADKPDAAAGPPIPPGKTAADKSAAAKPVEIGGPPGPEPTRYGDWQFKGRVTDF